ncbi:MAG: FAD-binding protein [Deltaproteobacteria bacterium]|nr:FAD-binding protein [Deltaproteobacteria bacterium]
MVSAARWARNFFAKVGELTCAVAKLGWCLESLDSGQRVRQRRLVRVRLEVAKDHDALGAEEADASDVARLLDVAEDEVREVRVIKRALDARRRLPKPLVRLTVEAEVARQPPESARRRLLDLPIARPRPDPPRAPRHAPPIAIVGGGPAGLFAAWLLAEKGAKVVLVERGKPVERRARDFGRFRGRGELDPESNLCFGEGGAGTYSDGKLTTRVKDPYVREVFERFVSVGAPGRILVDAKPHIGTNLLYRLLIRLRARLTELGVDLRFETRFERLRMRDGRLDGIETSTGSIDAPRVILAMGHSARDTFASLVESKVPVIAKPFAVGARIEHPQAQIDRIQYRCSPRPATLPPADYSLTHQAGGRGVYSFCMCPGGMIVPTSAEPGSVVVNGMSTARRSSPFANGGLVVAVGPEDFRGLGHGSDVLAGVRFQRALESACFSAGGSSYFAPAMRAMDLVKGKSSGRLADSHFRPGLTATDLREVLPPLVLNPLREGLRAFESIMRGYLSEEVNLIAVETKTSSPIQIPRDRDTFEVPGFRGLFVAGEGPGHAGGISSAAVDGLRVAEHLLGTLGEFA